MGEAKQRWSGHRLREKLLDVVDHAAVIRVFEGAILALPAGIALPVDHFVGRDIRHDLLCLHDAHTEGENSVERVEEE